MTIIGGAAPVAGRELMKTILGVSASLAITLAAVSPAQAAGSLANAEKLRRLNIMLMVTSLRCRATADSFATEYNSFTTSHLSELNQANARIREEMALRLGPVRGAMELDRQMTVTANAYGQGHPWLSCRDLKIATRDLARAQGADTLLEAADQLVGEERSSELALARR